ncbi:MAG: PEGA domain-containing protein [Spirochaetaceae bacterium]|jgi:hypothetical protein|nr:PEGA domain-containing protein [Spirochaetaceae bacterium]
MKRALLCFIIALGGLSTVAAKGAQETKPAPVNDTWTLCITEFDISSLPQGRAVTAQIIMRYMLENIRSMDTRLWTSPEAAYYNNTARRKAESAAAKALRDKQAERDKLIFAGETERKYKQNLKKIDDELAVLRYNLEKAEAVPVTVAVSPAAKLTADNYNGIYPAPPAPGQEYYFCSAQKADAFLSGKITEYFGRIYLEIFLWSIYARKITYQDSIIFSPEDMKEGVGEISDKLFDYISGFLPAWLRVKAEPEGSIIVIDDYVAGESATEAIDFTPGTVSVTAFRQNYMTFKADVDLREGELADVTIELTPVPSSEFDVTLKDEGNAVSLTGEETLTAGGASVYDGALYVGETPLKMSAPFNEPKSLSVETPDGRVAQSVFHVSEEPIVFNPAFPPPEDRVSVARKKFYSAYGRFWIALPFAILGMGLNSTMSTVYNSTGDPSIGQQRDIVYWVSNGLSVAAGLFLAESFYRIGRYVWEASKETSLLLKKEPPIEESGAEIDGEPVEGENSDSLSVDGDAVISDGTEAQNDEN